MDGPLDVNARLTASQAAAYAGVSVQAISNWRRRGHLRPVDCEGGRPRYRLLDVARAEHKTRRRARRQVRT